MAHSITHIIPVPARSAGSLPGFEAVCTCGHHIGSSLETLARQWGWQHADYMNSKAAQK